MKRTATLTIGMLASAVVMVAGWYVGGVSKARAAVGILYDQGVVGLARELTGQANIPWESAAPQSRGFDSLRLEALGDQLQAKSTDVFLVVRGGDIVTERYTPGFGPNTLIGLAAMAKAVSGSMALLLCLADQRVSLDETVGSLYAAWSEDSVKSRITIRQLATHSSGLDDVDFTAVGDGWKQYYYDHPDQRFQVALERAPALFEPGSHQSYSGLGYYVLAYALTKSLRDAPEKDLATLLRKRLFEPLSVPRRAWQISYGESHEFDGLKLYAIGSGASFTARAVARIGQLVLDRGAWRGQQLMPATWFDTLRTIVPLAADRRLDQTELGAGLGWWMNSDRSAPSLPSDAMVGLGNGDRVLLVVPSLSLVVVRSGELLAPAEGNAVWKNPWSRLDEHLFRPLMATLAGTFVTAQ